MLAQGREPRFRAPPRSKSKSPEGRRYPGLDLLAKSRLSLVPDTGSEGTTDTALQLSA